MPSYGYSPDVIKDWLIGGVDFDLAGNGGPTCTDFTANPRRLIEFVFGIVFASGLIAWAYKNCSLPEYRHAPRRDRGGRKTLLAIVSLVFGMEVAYKFATKTVIFLLNPCHVITAIQIYLLAATPSRFVTALFRIHLNFLNGALLALVFPVTNTLFLPFETEIYFIQHFMMLVTPYYLLRVGGAYNVEKFKDFSWTYMGYAVMILYHFIILMPIAVPLQVNLSQTLCPAISDPFYGPDYRIYTLFHQAIFVPFLCKVYVTTCQYFITKFPLTKVKSSLDYDLGLLTNVEIKNGIKQCHHCNGPCQIIKHV
ncbi:transmembrane protein 164 isoform X2 [Folsomia candida]|uniref:transmembrane protein 164 isoform X2 n=1 Tax=Folsomia candida TaxID=158441 RepID=UPI000B90480F|nr:transmembrane protein 164 isoform X2 [Folsomia candida]